jgi:hypothetical protein
MSVEKNIPVEHETHVQLDPGRDEVSIWFSASTDVYWHRSPKLTVGEHATFFPRISDTGDIFGLPKGAEFVESPDDVKP